MQATHTRGPWVALPRYTDSNVIPIGRPIVGGHAIFAECNGLGGVTGETEGDANARLIAAAPDLLDALRPLASEPHTPDDALGGDERVTLTFSMSEVRSARAAIAKATGGVEAEADER